MLEAAHARSMADFQASAEYKQRRNTRIRAAACQVFTRGFLAAVAVKLRVLVSNWAELEHALQDVSSATTSLFEGSMTMPKLNGRKGRDPERDPAAGWVAGRQTPANWDEADSEPSAGDRGGVEAARPG